MPTPLIYEIIGYIASLLVAISLMMSSILKLRIINLVGAVFFTIYGLLIHAYPVAAVNFFIVLIDLYYLYQMVSAKEFFRLLEVRPDSEYLRYFLSFYEKDIRRFQPDFTFSPQPQQLTLFVLRNLVPAGLVIGEVREAGSLYLQLDYAIPGYRDLKIGRFVYQQHTQDFRARGIQRIYAQAGAPSHNRYLEQIGFTQEPRTGGEQQYCRTLD
jgi:hypothetical protein